MKTNHLFPCLFLLTTSATFPQGSLTPPGTPAPTMKTLQQIEPRVDLQNAPASAVGTIDPSYHFIINQPGSYYLSANLGVTKAHGIQINTEGVTLDLNGFEISRASGSGGNGIEISAASHRATVRNGSLKGFAFGIRSLLQGARACAFRDLSVTNCYGAGIEVGDGAVLESCRLQDNSSEGMLTGSGSSLTNCVATNNTGTSAIRAGSGSSLTNCVATNNTVAAGIIAGVGSSLTNCVASANTSPRPFSYGILVDQSTVTGCTAQNNTNTYFTASNSSGVGIYGGSSSTITNCTAQGNKGDGIQVTDKCVIHGCSANYNGNGTTGSGVAATTECTITDSGASVNRAHGFTVGNGSNIQGCTARENNGDGIRAGSNAHIIVNNASGNAKTAGTAGIHITGNGGRIEENHASNNGFDGIWLDDATTNNFVMKNTARSNGGFQYRIQGLTVGGLTGTNEVGPLQTLNSATNSWANFQ